MKQITVTRHIAAPPARVWSILTDAEALVRGQTGITRLDGPIEEGKTIRLENGVAPGRTFQIQVAELRRGARMVWHSGMPLRLFHGRRVFTAAAEGTGTSFSMTETYTGPLLPLMWRVMPDLAPSFDMFADGLARLAETAEGERR